MKPILSVFTVTIALLLAGCYGRPEAFRLEASDAQQIDPLPALCPSFTTDARGAVVLSWVRSLSDSSFVLCYARSTDGGKSFSAPVVVTPSTNVKPHSENLPRLLFKPSGEVVALWGAASGDARNKYAGVVYYSQSFDQGRSWSTARRLVTDTSGYDQRYFDVALLPSGEAAIVWLDNRKNTEGEGSALYYATTRGRSGFVGERRVAQQCCPCCRTDLFVDRKGGIHVLYRGIIQDSIRDMVHTVSLDGGKTFSAPQRISNDNWVIEGCPHTGPSMTENKEGLHFAWYTGGGKKGSFYTRSLTNGQSFAPSDSVSPLGKHPQLAALGDEALLIAWDEPVAQGGQFYTRIGVQKRSATGVSQGRAVLTAGAQNASYPVVAPLSNEAALVAYCREAGGQKYVAWQRVAFR